jgi:D-alanyl-D-alanine carboxypeptidase
VLSHQGSLPGYVTVMVHHRSSSLTVALTTNTGSGNRLSFYAADTILRRVPRWIG